MGTVNIDIKTQDAQTLAALKRLEREFRGLDSTIDKTSKRGVGLGDVMGGLAIGAGVKYAIGEFEDAERTSRKMEAAILASGNAAGVSAEEQRKYADELANTIAVDNDVVIAAGTRLRAYQAIKGERFHETLAVAADVAAAKEKDLASVSDQLGKALNSPAQAAKILRSLGIALTEQQQEQIKVMTEAGDVAGAQGLILDELKKRYAGAAEANVTDSQRMKVAMDDAAESAGEALAPALTLAADTVGVLAGAFSALPVPIQQATFATGLGVAAWSRMSPGIDSARTSLDKWLSKIETVPAGSGRARTALGGLSSSIGGATGAMNLATVAAGPAAIAVLGLGLRAEEAAKNAKIMDAAVADLTGRAEALGKTVDEVFRTDFLIDAVKVDPELAADLEAAGGSLAGFAEAAVGTDEQWNTYKDNLSGDDFDNNALKIKLEQQREFLLNSRDASEAAAGAQEELGGATDEATEATADYIAKSGNLLGALDGSKTAWTDQATAVRDANEALRDNMALAGDALTAKLNFDSAQRDVSTATLDLAAARESGDQYKIEEAEDRLTAAMQRQSEAAVTVAEANAKVEGRVLSAGEAYLIQQGQLDGLRDKTGFWNDDLQVLEDRLKVFAETYKADIDTEDAKKKLIELIDLGNRARTALFGESAPAPGTQQTVPPPRDPDAGPRSLRGLSGAAGGSVIVNLNAPGMVVGATKKDAAIVARRASRKIAQQIRVAS